MVATMINAAISYTAAAPDVDVLRESVHSMPVTRWRVGRDDQSPPIRSPGEPSQEMSGGHWRAG